VAADQPARAFADTGAGRSEGKVAATLADSLDADVRRAPKDESFKFSGTVTNAASSVALATRSVEPQTVRARDRTEELAVSGRADKSFASAPAPTLAPPASVAGSLALAPSGKADHYAATTSAGRKSETDVAANEAVK